jgi:hypothetical protein
MITLTRDAVGKVARALITLEGETTTLDVKNKLRELGFFAKQDEVRNFMLDITSKDGDVQYVDGPDGYRIYKFVTPFPGIDTDDFIAQVSNVLDDFNNSGAFDSSVPQTSGPTHIITANQFNPTSPSGVEPLHRDLVKANYSVTDEQGLHYRYYANVDRREAKRLWSKETGLHYFRAYTKKLS